MTDLRPTIETALKAFPDSPLREAGLNLLSTLGYASDRTLDLDGSPALPHETAPITFRT